VHLSDSKDFALYLAQRAFDKKAFELKILAVSDLVGYTDYIIVCSGRSDRQVQAIADHVALSAKKELDVLPLGVEGESLGQWALMDFGNVVVHVFNAPIREYYDVERLWGDAEQLEVETPPWEAEMRESLLEQGIF
jgi:ribosome-associated protein